MQWTDDDAAPGPFRWRFNRDVSARVEGAPRRSEKFSILEPGRLTQRAQNTLGASGAVPQTTGRNRQSGYYSKQGVDAMRPRSNCQKGG